MADTTTTNLLLTKPEVGASTDSWGTKINTDLDTIDALFDAGPLLKVTKGGTGVGTSTGTGNNVLSASPTFTGTVALAALTASGNLTLNGGTANGVAYLNGSKVLTTGSALTFDGTNLGVGVASPAAKFDAAGAGSRIQLNLSGATAQYYAVNPANSALADSQYLANLHIWSAAGTERMRLDSSGNLGLGVTPSAWNTGVRMLEFTGGAVGTNNTPSQLYLLSNAILDSGGWKYKITNAAARQEIVNGTFTWSTAPSGTAGNAISFTQAMTLDASGNLLVGQTVVGETNSNGFWTYPTGGKFGQNHTNGTSSGAAYAQWAYNGSIIGSITQNGTTGVLYNITSDQRLKENIQDAEDAATLIDAIQVRQYDWKSDGSHQRYGFIAQELVTVAPEAVHQPADPEEMMAVDYSKLVPMLVKEIQSLRQRLAALESN